MDKEKETCWLNADIFLSQEFDTMASIKPKIQDWDWSKRSFHRCHFPLESNDPTLSVQAFHPWSPHYTKSKSTTLACKLTSQTNLWASQRIPIRLEVSVQVSWEYWNLPNDRNLHIQNRMVQPIQKYLETSPMYWVTIINYKNSSMGKTNICQLPPQCLLCAFSL